MKKFKVLLDDGSVVNCVFNDAISAKSYYENFLRMSVISIEEINEDSVCI